MFLLIMGAYAGFGRLALPQGAQMWCQPPPSRNHALAKLEDVKIGYVTFAHLNDALGMLSKRSTVKLSVRMYRNLTGKDALAESGGSAYLVRAGFWARKDLSR